MALEDDFHKKLSDDRTERGARQNTKVDFMRMKYVGKHVRGAPNSDNPCTCWAVYFVGEAISLLARFATPFRMRNSERPKLAVVLLDGGGSEWA